MTTHPGRWPNDDTPVEEIRQELRRVGCSEAAIDRAITNLEKGRLERQQERTRQARRHSLRQQFRGWRDLT